MCDDVSPKSQSVMWSAPQMIISKDRFIYDHLQESSFARIFRETSHILSISKFLIYIDKFFGNTSSRLHLLAEIARCMRNFFFICTAHSITRHPPRCAYVCDATRKERVWRMKRELSLSFKNSIFLAAEIVCNYRKTHVERTILTLGDRSHRHQSVIIIIVIRCEYCPRRKLFIFILFLLLTEDY